MRPDREFPLFWENNALIKNTYLRPRHDGEDEGDIEPLLTFMQRFLPHEGEREWFFDWMAHKQWKPWIPGTAVWFVADTPEEEGPRGGEFGTGRGFMFRIGRMLYDEAYVRAEDFSILAGTSGQSDYTDWQHNCVLVTVNEANSSEIAHRRGHRRSVYEVLRIASTRPSGHAGSRSNTVLPSTVLFTARAGSRPITVTPWLFRSRTGGCRSCATAPR
jgi:hypothetical protein